MRLHPLRLHATRNEFASKTGGVSGSRAGATDARGTGTLSIAGRPWVGCEPEGVRVGERQGRQPVCVHRQPDGDQDGRDHEVDALNATLVLPQNLIQAG